jgi:endonuclease/exonuclease/phosphatase (EEP) superfamily protein YafD
MWYYHAGNQANIIIGIFLIIIGVQGYKAWPYTPLATRQVKLAASPGTSKTSISLYISNVLQDNRNYQKTIDKINFHHPEIVITTETDAAWQKALSALHDQYPYRVAVPQDNKYGMHLFSKLPLKDPKVRFLMEDDIPSIRTQVQLESGDWITLFIVHPRPPVPNESKDSRDRDAEIILVARETKEIEGGIIVAGDFNDVAWSETTELFQKVSGFLDPRRGRGFFNTFHAKYPIFRWPLDHIFHSNHFRLKGIQRVKDIDSDHFPMFVHLSYEPEKKASQPEEKPDGDTWKDANETIQKGSM